MLNSSFSGPKHASKDRQSDCKADFASPVAGERDDNTLNKRDRPTLCTREGFCW